MINRRIIHKMQELVKALRRLLSTSNKEYLIMANIADNVLALQTAVAALDAKVSALPTAGGGSVDLTPVTTAVAAVQTTVNDIDAKLTPSS